MSRAQNTRLKLVLLQFYLVADELFNLCGPALIVWALIIHTVISTASPVIF